MIKPTLKYFSFLILLVVVSSCLGNDEYTVEKNRVGLLTSETKVMELEELFKNDSIVAHLSEGVLGYQGRYSQEDDFYLIYSSKGKHLLTLTPNEPLDSLSTIRIVDIHEGIYKTEDGIGLDSKFEEINLAMNISKIESTFTKVVLYLDQMNATMTLDKLDLGINTIQTDDVQLEQIPNLVKPKSFVIWFD